MSEGMLGDGLGDITRLEEIVDRESLAEVCRSFFELFGLPIRLFSSGGALLSDVHQERAICRYANSFEAGAAACSALVLDVKRSAPREPALHECFTGAVYRVVPVLYQGRTIGRFVVGPYLPAELAEVPESLLDVDENLDPEAAQVALAEMPRVREETALRICIHLERVLEMILFARHRAHLTSEMHVASVRENYRELAEKTAKLQQAYEELRELDRLKSNFLATVSHELRTPLTSIIGYSEMLASGIAGDLSDEQSDFVETIRTKGDHLLALITSLLDFSKLEHGKLSLKSEQISPHELLDEVAKNIIPTATKRRVAVDVSLEDNLPRLVGDPMRLRQVLFNLADNALKFTPEGGKVRLEARASSMEPEGDGDLGMVLMAAPRRAVEFAVADTGVGISEEEQAKIFNAFYQVDGSSTREHGGIGLGLSIVRRLAEAHGGNVRVESARGEGTTFFVTVPEPEDG